MVAGCWLLGRYDEDQLLAMFDEAGVLAKIGERGFHDFAFELDEGGGALAHARLFGRKHGGRHLLLDGCLTEVTLEGGAPRATFDLLVIYWLREQDPTATFEADHPRLPLQEHPGLGVLRRAFRVALRIAGETEKDGIGAFPKFFHDAAMFYRSRLFLFHDPAEQGRFEALLRDLGSLSLCDASLALVGNAVRDADGSVVAWRSGMQVMPLSPALTGTFHSQEYQLVCRRAFETCHYVIDDRALQSVREVFLGSIDEGSSCKTSGR